jgi:hypothetical protein
LTRDRHKRTSDRRDERGTDFERTSDSDSDFDSDSDA